MTPPPSGDDLRRMAAHYAGQARMATLEERKRLLKMEALMLDLARSQDLLDGKKGKPE
ncbi:MAG: hypothetical protein AB7K04_15460 [Pseudorhodoplanes sp.]